MTLFCLELHGPASAKMQDWQMCFKPHRKTAWEKTQLYIFNTDLTTAGKPMDLIPSVPKNNPSSLITHWNLVTIICDYVLEVPINCPDLHFLHINIISAFTFPYLKKNPSLWLFLPKYYYNVYSQKFDHALPCSPSPLSLAQKLDHLVAKMIHGYLGFPFHF